MGGNLPLILRIPKRGFVSPFKVRLRLVQVADLEAAFEAGAEVTPASLASKGLVSSERPGVKILGTGEIKKALKVSAHAFSESAKAKITAAGGTCTVLK
jgi:large subunit ribosomal protein L15